MLILLLVGWASFAVFRVIWMKKNKAIYKAWLYFPKQEKIDEMIRF
jgi:hypothetical protein